VTDAVVGPPLVSVVVPALHAGATLAECLRALKDQSLAANLREVIVVVDARSTDASEAIARASGFKVVLHEGNGAGSGRNAGVSVASGEWIAFTDADCVPTRRWLDELLKAAETSIGLGAAGPTIGLESTSAAARFVDLTSGLDAERHLSHERYPWAPTCNVIYRRSALASVGGFDQRFRSYEGCDLNTRLRRTIGGDLVFARRAVVMHRHRASWRAYWKQQVNYGRGFAQFFLRYRDELAWSAGDEARAWTATLALGARALIRPRGDEGLVRRGHFVKALAQRRGFVSTYWRRNSADGWREPAETSIETAQ